MSSYSEDLFKESVAKIFNIERIDYPHYIGLPEVLRVNLSLLRTAVYSGVWHECREATLTIDRNDLTFLNLDSLVDWVKLELPDFDVDFLEAAARLHKEHYIGGLYNKFCVEEKDLFEEVMFMKDCYELKLTRGL